MSIDDQVTRASRLAGVPADRPAGIHHGTKGVAHADFILALSVVGDALATLLSLTVAFWIRFRSGTIPFFGMDDPRLRLGDYIPLFVVGTVFLLLAFAFLGLYDITVIMRLRRVADIIFRGTAFWLFAYLGSSLALKFEPQISRVYVVVSFFVSLAILLSWRRLLHGVLHMESIARTLRRRVVFVGWKFEADRLNSAMQIDRSNPYEAVGCVLPPHGGFAQPPPPSVPQLGAYSELAGILRRRDADIVVLAEPETNAEEIIEMANLCEREFAHFKVVPSYFQILASSLHLETISGVPILGVTDLPLNRTLNRIAKRVIDVTGAIVGLVGSAPVLGLFGLLIYFESPGAIWFSQERIGRNGKKFKMYKLRSMVIGADKLDHLNQSTLRDDPRLLRVGKALRKWNIDEIPQFWNVLKGEMSLVGPRPERSFHSERLSEEIPHYNARYGSKPGMTGWAQVNGLRGNTSLEERIRYDLFYLENWSLWLDFQVMFLTFVRRENAY
jgi:exopolysaccharide biosynthesis polyprenyl glycosylphosphotransferase